MPKTQAIVLSHTASQPAAAHAKKPKLLPGGVAASVAKAHFLHMLSCVEQSEEFVITRRGKPVARLVPFEAPKRDIVGCMKEFGEVKFLGDAMEPLPLEEWGDLY